MDSPPTDMPPTEDPSPLTDNQSPTHSLTDSPLTDSQPLTGSQPTVAPTVSPPTAPTEYTRMPRQVVTTTRVPGDYSGLD